jgi:outer membrane protein OmpA-like peptidoglycan-associated protein
MKKSFFLLLSSVVAAHAIDNLFMTFKYGPTDLSGGLSFNKHTFGIDIMSDTGGNIKPKIDLGYLLVDEGGEGVDYTLQFSANALYEGSEFYYDSVLPYAYAGVGYEYVHNSRPGFDSNPYLQIAGGVEFPLFGSSNDDHKIVAEARWMQMMGGDSGQESEAAIFVGFRFSTGAIGFSENSSTYRSYEEERYAEIDADERPKYAPELAAKERILFSDADGDGIPDKDDKCPHTPPGTVVDEMGCPDHVVKSAWKSYKKGTRSPKKHVTFKPLPRERKRLTLPFESDSAEISPKGREQIRRFVEILNRRGYKYITVEGYTDNSGTMSQNVALSKKRAEKVRALMIQYGIDPQKITAVGKGALNPIGDNDVPEGRALNRRIEIVYE